MKGVSEAEHVKNLLSVNFLVMPGRQRYLMKS